MTRALLLSLALLALPTAAQGQRQRHFPADDDLALMLRYLVEDGEAPGAVLGVRDPDGSTRVVHYGISGPDSVQIGPDAVFEIGSVTKTFTGTLLADMVLRGEVSLDDPVSRYLPDEVRMPSRNYVRLEEEGWLTYQPQGAVRARLYARSDSSFYLLRGPWSLTFARSGQGDVTLHMAVDEREPAQQGRVELTIRKVSSEAPPPRAVAGNAGFGASWGTGIWVLLGIAGVVGVVVTRPIWRRRPR